MEIWAGEGGCSVLSIAAPAGSRLTGFGQERRWAWTPNPPPAPVRPAVLFSHSNCSQLVCNMCIYPLSLRRPHPGSERPRRHRHLQMWFASLEAAYM